MSNNPVISDILLLWYNDNARCLPWRDNPSPYRVWISEIMLQQTRVETVIPYFKRFIKELPNVQMLANADEQILLKLWEGLGYYHRVKNLKATACTIVQDYNGIIPSDFEQLIKLPGIGRYSAGAIASIAYGVRIPAIDGNVLRVMARITANDSDISQKEVKNYIEKIVAEILPAGHISEFNQALMELGATICLPNGAPKCEICPAHNTCKSCELGLTAQLPVKTKRKPRRIEERSVFLIFSNGKFAIRRRAAGGLLPLLWEYPNANGSLTAEECETVLQNWNIDFSKMKTLKNAKHVFTHIEWQMKGYLVYAKSYRSTDDIIWVTPEEIASRYALPSAFHAYSSIIKSLSQSEADY